MKKLLILLLSFAVFSCNVEDLNPKLIGTYKFLRFESNGVNYLKNFNYAQIILEDSGLNHKLNYKIILNSNGIDDKSTGQFFAVQKNGYVELTENDKTVGKIDVDDLILDYVSDKGNKIYIIARKQ